MKRSLLPLALLGLATCSRGPTLLVTVENVPAMAQSLHIVAAHSDVGTQKVLAAINDLEPFKLASPAATTSTFLLRLPGGFSGDINISVGAFAGADASGCLVANGNASQPMFVGRDETLRVPLDPFTDATCSGKKPMLTSISPALGSTNGGEKVTLTGWGFKPGASVTMGSKPATNVTFKSASTLEVTTPSKAGFGLTSIKVVNTDMKEDSRKDLFRFYAPSLSFTGFPFSNNSSYSGGGVVISHFDPTTLTDVAISLTNNNSVRVLFTIGTNVVSNKTKEYPVGNKPGPIVAADFDKDGDNDIIVANINDGTIQLLKNNGDGSFVVGSPQNVGINPEAIIAGDLNGDGAADLVVANRYNAPASGKLQILLNDGSGTLSVKAGQVAVDTGVEPVGLALGDFNVDGKPDIAVANRGPETVGGSDYRVNLIFNQGDGFYSDRGTGALALPVCKEPTSVLVSDVNNNGIDDLLVSCSGEDKVQVWDNSGGLNVRDYTLATDMRPRNLALTDLNGDGYADLIVPAENGNSVNFFLNKQGAGFEGLTPLKKAAQCSKPYQIIFLDVDIDGKADVGIVGDQCIAGFFNQSQ